MDKVFIFLLVMCGVNLFVYILDRQSEKKLIDGDVVSFRSNRGIRLFVFLFEIALPIIWYEVILESTEIDSGLIVTSAGLVFLMILGVELWPGRIVIDKDGVKQYRLLSVPRFIPWKEYTGCIFDYYESRGGPQSYICGADGYRIWASDGLYDFEDIKKTLEERKPTDEMSIEPKEEGKILNIPN